jgi:vanillate O-demethylase ferredoxin subunit
MRHTPDLTEAVIQSIQDITPTVREFTLKPSQGVQHFDPGSHLQVQVLVRAQPQMRTYSLVGAPNGDSYRIAVKRLPQGRGGSRALWALKVGERLRISPPQNHFSLDLSAPAYLLVAGGIGITPLVLMAQTLAMLSQKLGQRGAPVKMLFGASTQAELAFAPVLSATLGARLHSFCADRGETIDFAAAIAALPLGGQLYICGPAPMLDAARRAWADAKRPPADLRFETFGNSGHFAPQAFRALLPRQNIDIQVAADERLLDALARAGVQSLSHCQRGECGLCAMEVLALDGEIDHRDVFLSDTEKQENKRLCICVSRVRGTITLDSSYRPED